MNLEFPSQSIILNRNEIEIFNPQWNEAVDRLVDQVKRDLNVSQDVDINARLDQCALLGSDGIKFEIPARKQKMFAILFVKVPYFFSKANSRQAPRSRVFLLMERARLSNLEAILVFFWFII
jgi:hypothetical protein